MIRRRYKEEDTKALIDIYYNTIHTINASDYTKEQLEAWAPSEKITDESFNKDVKRWKRINPFVVLDKDIVVGFAELEENAHINCFFVHHLYQGEGIGSMLMNACIKEGKKLGYKKLITEVSVTAKEFFLKKGFNISGIEMCDINGSVLKFHRMEIHL